MSTTEQMRQLEANRRPDGRFGPGGQMAEASLDLELAPDGSFYWPPRLRTAEDVIDFFENVHLPDEAITRFATQYKAVWESREKAARLAYAQEQIKEWEKQNPSPLLPGKREQWDIDRQARFEVLSTPNEKSQALGRAHVRNVPAWGMRILARSARMYMHARDELPAAEREKVFAHEMEFGAGQKSSIGALAKVYWFDQSAVSVTGESAANDALDLREQLRYIEKELDRANASLVNAERHTRWMETRDPKWLPQA